MSNIVYIQVSIFPIAALLAVMDNLKRDMSFHGDAAALKA